MNFTAAVQRLCTRALSNRTLTLVCRKCTGQAQFTGMDRDEAVQEAVRAGWDVIESACPMCQFLKHYESLNAK
jgi:hypothetical protein